MRVTEFACVLNESGSCSGSGGNRNSDFKRRRVLPFRATARRKAKLTWAASANHSKYIRLHEHGILEVMVLQTLHMKRWSKLNGSNMVQWGDYVNALSYIYLEEIPRISWQS
jgi:hypothetical protein